MTLAEVVTYIITPILAGLAAVWGVVKVIVPRLVEAKLEEQREQRKAEADEREHQQRQQELTLGYQQAEASVAQQRLAELLHSSQEYIQEQLTDDLKVIVEIITRLDNRDELHLKEFERLTGLVWRIEHEQRNLRTDFRLLLGIVEEVYESWKHQNRTPSEDA